MAGKYSLTLQLQLQSPQNVAQVVKQLQNQLGAVAVNIQVKNAAKATQQVNQLATATNNASNAAAKMGDAFGVSLKRFAAFSLASRAIGVFTRGLAGAIDSAIDFQNELVKISQITGENLNDLGKLTKEITSLATTFGVASNEILGVTNILAQAGIKANDLTIAIRTLTKTKLAPTFGDIQDTAEGAVALIAQFEQGVGALERQLGAVNRVAAEFAVESQDLIEVIRRTGGVFKASGGDLEELLALFTSVRATTRESAESIATALKTIFTRIQRPETIQYLRQFGIELVDLNGKFVGPYEAVRRLSQELSSLGEGDIRFISIAEELGGYRQIGKVIPLLRQFETAERARQVALEAGNSLNEDAAKAQQSLAVQFTRTREKFLALIRGISETSSFQLLVKTSLNLANALISVADALKPIIPLVATLAAVKFGANIGSFFGSVGAAFTRKQFGGPIQKFASGGMVPGSGNRDTVPAMLTPGEFVIRKSSVKKLGAGTLAAMNENRYNKGTVGKGVKPSKPLDLPTPSGKTNFTHVTKRLTEDDFSRNKSAAKFLREKGIVGIYNNMGLDLPQEWNSNWNKQKPDFLGAYSKTLADYIKNNDIFKTLKSGRKKYRFTGRSNSIAQQLLNKKDEEIKQLLYAKLKRGSSVFFDTDPDVSKVLPNLLKDSIKQSFQGEKGGAANTKKLIAGFQEYSVVKSEGKRQSTTEEIRKKLGQKKFFGGTVQRFVTGGDVKAAIRNRELVEGSSKNKRFNFANTAAGTTLIRENEQFYSKSTDKETLSKLQQSASSFENNPAFIEKRTVPTFGALFLAPQGETFDDLIGGIDTKPYVDNALKGQSDAAKQYIDRFYGTRTNYRKAFRIKSSTLKKSIRDDFEDGIYDGILKTVQDGTKRLIDKTKIDEGGASRAAEILKKTNIDNTVGNMFDAIIRNAGGKYGSKEVGFDFPSGAGNLVDAFSNMQFPKNIPTEAKASYSTDLIRDIGNKVDSVIGQDAKLETETTVNQLLNRYNATASTKKAFGGVVQKFVRGGKSFKPKRYQLTKGTSPTANLYEGMSEEQIVADYVLQGSEKLNSVFNKNPVRSLNPKQTKSIVGKLSSAATDELPPTLFHGFSYGAWQQMSKQLGLDASQDTFNKIVGSLSYKVPQDPELAKSLIGKAFSLPGFLSTSVSDRAAARFMAANTGGLLTILTNKAKKGINVSKYAGSSAVQQRQGASSNISKLISEEQEYILTKGNRFSVRNVSSTKLGTGDTKPNFTVQQLAKGGAVQKFAKGGKAYVFDFDDTLATTEARIGGPNDPDKFSQFRGALGAKLIESAQASKIAAMAKKRYQRGHDVHVLTARPSDAETIEAISQFMQRVGAPAKSVVGVGNMFAGEREPGKRPGTTRLLSTGSKKAKVLSQIAPNYDETWFLDDAVENLVAAKKVAGVKTVQADLDAKRTVRRFWFGGAAADKNAELSYRRKFLPILYRSKNQLGPDAEYVSENEAGGYLKEADIEPLRQESMANLGKSEARYVRKTKINLRNANEMSRSSSLGDSVPYGTFRGGKFNSIDLQQDAASPTVLKHELGHAKDAAKARQYVKEHLRPKSNKEIEESNKDSRVRFTVNPQIQKNERDYYKKQLKEARSAPVSEKRGSFQNIISELLRKDFTAWMISLGSIPSNYRLEFAELFADAISNPAMPPEVEKILIGGTTKADLGLQQLSNYFVKNNQPIPGLGRISQDEIIAELEKRGFKQGPEKPYQRPVSILDQLPTGGGTEGMKKRMEAIEALLKTGIKGEDYTILNKEANWLKTRMEELSRPRFPRRYAAGGAAPSDTVPALLTPGEFVFSKKAAQSIGYGALNRMNKHGVAGYAKGGPVAVKKFATGGANGVNAGVSSIVQDPYLAASGAFALLTGTLGNTETALGRVVNYLGIFATSITSAITLLNAFGATKLITSSAALSKAFANIKPNSFKEFKQLLGTGKKSIGAKVFGLERDATGKTKTIIRESFSAGFNRGQDDDILRERRKQSGKVKSADKRIEKQQAELDTLGGFGKKKENRLAALDASKSARQSTIASLGSKSSLTKNEEKRLAEARAEKQEFADLKRAKDLKQKIKQNKDKRKAAQKEVDKRSSTSIFGNIGESLSTFAKKNAGKSGITGFLAKTTQSLGTKFAASGLGGAGVAAAGSATAAGGLAATLAAATGPIAAITTGITVLNGVLGAAIDAQGRYTKAVEKGDAVNAAYYASLKEAPGLFQALDQALNVFGTNISLFSDAFNVAASFLGGPSLTYIKSNAKAQALAARAANENAAAQEKIQNSLKAIQEGRKSATEIVNETGSGRRITDQVNLVNQQLEETRKAQSANLSGKSTGTNAFIRNISAYTIGLPFGQETSGTKNMRIEKEARDQMIKSINDSRQAFNDLIPILAQYGKELLLPSVAGGNAAQIAAAKQDAKSKILARAGVTGLNEAGQQRLTDLENKKRSGTSLSAEEDVLLADLQAQKAKYDTINEMIDQQAKALEENLKYIESLNFGFRSVSSAAIATSRGLETLASSVETGYNSFDNAYNTLETALTSAGANLNTTDVEASLGTLTQTLAAYGASQGQIDKATGSFTALYTAQSELEGALEKTKETLKAGGGAAPNVIKEVLSTNLRNALLSRGIDDKSADRIVGSIQKLDLGNEDIQQKILSGDLGAVAEEALGPLKEAFSKEILGPLQERAKQENVLINLTKQRIDLEKSAIDARKQSIDIELEARKAIEEFGGPVVKSADKLKLFNQKIDLNLRNAGVGGVGAGSVQDVAAAQTRIRRQFSNLQNAQNISVFGGGAGAFAGAAGVEQDKRPQLEEAQQALIDYTRQRLDLIREEIEIAKKKNELEKSAAEKLITGDIEGFIQSQQAAAAASILRIGDEGLAKLFSPTALGEAFKSLEGQGLTKDEMQKAAATALSPVGGNTRMAQVLSGTTPEIQQLESQGRGLASIMSEAGASFADMQQMKVNAQQVVIQAAEVKMGAQMGVAPTNLNLSQNPIGFKKGGPVYANRGIFVPRGTDTVPAMLSPGEFVVNAKSAQQNLGLLSAINGGAQTLSRGGVVYAKKGGEAWYDNTAWQVAKTGLGFAGPLSVISDLMEITEGFSDLTQGDYSKGFRKIALGGSLALFSGLTGGVGGGLIRAGIGLGKGSLRVGKALKQTEKAKKLAKTLKLDNVKGGLENLLTKNRNSKFRKFLDPYKTKFDDFRIGAKAQKLSGKKNPFGGTKKEREALTNQIQNNFGTVLNPKTGNFFDALGKTRTMDTLKNPNKAAKLGAFFQNAPSKLFEKAGQINGSLGKNKLLNNRFLNRGNFKELRAIGLGSSTGLRSAAGGKMALQNAIGGGFIKNYFRGRSSGLEDMEQYQNPALTSKEVEDQMKSDNERAAQIARERLVNYEQRSPLINPQRFAGGGNIGGLPANPVRRPPVSVPSMGGAGIRGFNPVARGQQMLGNAMAVQAAGRNGGGAGGISSETVAMLTSAFDSFAESVQTLQSMQISVKLDATNINVNFNGTSFLANLTTEVTNGVLKQVVYKIENELMIDNTGKPKFREARV